MLFVVLVKELLIKVLYGNCYGDCQYEIQVVDICYFIIIFVLNYVKVIGGQRYILVLQEIYQLVCMG